MGVDVAPPGGHLLVQGGDTVQDGHGALLRNQILRRVERRSLAD
jgi:hypothetical protein